MNNSRLETKLPKLTELPCILLHKKRVIFPPTLVPWRKRLQSSSENEDKIIQHWSTHSRRVLKWIWGDKMLRNLARTLSRKAEKIFLLTPHLLLRMKVGRGVLEARMLSVISKMLQHFTPSRVSLTQTLGEK